MGSVTEHKYKLLGIVLAFIIIKIIQYKYRQYQLYLVKIDILYEEVLKKLKTQSNMTKENPEVKDLILSNEDNLHQRITMWKDVSVKVEHNSNISSQIVENNGEIMKVWEYIGI